jgi:hypothetical protein
MTSSAVQPVCFEAASGLMHTGKSVPKGKKSMQNPYSHHYQIPTLRIRAFLPSFVIYLHGIVRINRTAFIVLHKFTKSGGTVFFLLKPLTLYI